MNFELTGTIKLIAEKEVFKSGFEKVEFVLTTNDIKYPEDVKFEVKGDKTDAFINDFNQGDVLTVFLTLEAMNIKINTTITFLLGSLLNSP